jgi:hypothetical protein
VCCSLEARQHRSHCRQVALCLTGAWRYLQGVRTDDVCSHFAGCFPDAFWNVNWPEGCLYVSGLWPQVLVCDWGFV